MTRDPLADPLSDALAGATAALRASADAPAEPEPTRARVLGTLRKRSRTRVVVLRTLIPIAAVLAGSLAWAAPGALPAAWRAIFGGARAPSEQSPPAGVEPPALPLPVLDAPSPSALPSATASGGIDAAPDATPPASPNEKEAATPAPPRRTPGGAAAQPQTSSPSPSASAAEPPDHAIYKRAHALHFSGGDPGAALRAWDEYLRAAPRGRFAMEAQYNRAICLVRLGRTGEASRALEPFANGSAGGYRQREAKTLQGALGAPR